MRCRACAALMRSPWAFFVARAASSAFAGQLRSRETSAISASATTHLARATASFADLKARDALRNRAFARDEVAKLRHGDAAQRQRRRVVAERSPASVRREDHPLLAPAPRP